MKTNISDYIHVFEKLDELGCSYSEGIAILPLNFETATPTTTIEQLMGTFAIEKLFRMNDVPCSEIRRDNEKPSYMGYRSAEWVLLTLFFSALLLSENPAIVSISLSVIANFLTDRIKETGSKQTSKLDIVIEIEKNKSKTYKKVSYEGPIDEMSKLDEIVKEVLKK